jgi:hypothetical protein
MGMKRLYQLVSYLVIFVVLVFSALLLPDTYLKTGYARECLDTEDGLIIDDFSNLTCSRSNGITFNLDLTNCENYYDIDDLEYNLRVVFEHPGRGTVTENTGWNGISGTLRSRDVPTQNTTTMVVGINPPSVVDGVAVRPSIQIRGEGHTGSVSVGGGTASCNFIDDEPSTCADRGEECGSAVSIGCCTSINLVCDDTTNTCVDSEEVECVVGDNSTCNVPCYPLGGRCTEERRCDCYTFTRPPAGPGGNLNPLDNPGELFQIFYRVLYPITLFVGLFLVAKASYTIMTSQGNPDSTKKGKEDLTSAIIGTLFVLLSAGILRVIINSLLGDPGF